MTTGQAWWDGPGRPAGYAASKVPLITAYFWIIKLLTTAMGEATSDYMVRTISPVTAVLLGFAGFAIAIYLQFRTKRYVAGIYWLAVVMVAVFGTMAADVLHIKFHVPYAASSTFYAIVLTVIFVLWYRSEGTLSIHSIRTPRREAFYWATVLATFALGTAVGDLTARTLHLGYLASGVVFTVLIMVPTVGHWRFGMNPILAFWIAYVLTRPVGASYADYVAFPRQFGGLDAGHGEVALVLTIIIIGLVAYLSVTRLDVEEAAEASDSRAAARHRRGLAQEADGFRSAAPGSGAGHRWPPPRPTEPRGLSEYRPPRRPAEPRRGPAGYGPALRPAEPRRGPGDYGPAPRPAEPRRGPVEDGLAPRPADPRSRREPLDTDWDADWEAPPPRQREDDLSWDDQ